MTYSEKLKDPRWQKKRLRILERDEFTCQKCESETKTLHVHHKYYLHGKDPWDYDDAVLITLCFECHEGEENSKQSPLEFIDELRRLGFFNTDFEGLFFRNSVLKKDDLLHLFVHDTNPLFVEEFRGLLQKHRQYLLDRRAIDRENNSSDGEDTFPL